MKDPLVINWIRAAISFDKVKCGIQPFISEAIETQHKTLLKDRKFSPSPPNKCTKCTRETLLPFHPKHKCIHRFKSRCFCKEDVRKRCLMGFCSIFYDLIIPCHAEANPLWDNTDPQRWFDHSWELAKCFIGTTGYADISSADDTDASGLLSIAINDIYIREQIGDIHVFKMCRDIRNEIFHTSTYKVTDDELRQYIDVEINVLQDKCFANNKAAGDAVLALKQLTQSISSGVSALDAKKMKLQSEKEKLEKCIKECRTNLVKWYKSFTIKTEINPLIPEDQVNIDDLYVPIKAEDKKPTDRQKTHKLIRSLHDIFVSEEKYIKQIFMTAEIGMGKTALCKKIASMWCYAHHSDEELQATKQEENDSRNRSCIPIFFSGQPQQHTFFQVDLKVLKEFSLLFIISMKDLQGEQTIEDMITSQILKRASKSTELEYLLQTTDHKYLVILDGLDQWTNTDIPNAPNVSKGLPLKQNEFRYSTIFTCRPWKLEHVRPKSYEKDEVIQIVELCNSSYEELVKRMEEILFHVKGSFLENFLGEMNKYEKLLPRNPLLVKFLIFLFLEQNQSFPNSVSVFMGYMVQMMLVYAEERNTNDVKFTNLLESLSDPNSVLPSCLESCSKLKENIFLLKTVGVRAFKKKFPQCENQNCYEHGNKEDEQHDSVLLKVGFVSQTRSEESLCFPQKSKSFLFQLLQDFCTALYIAFNPDEDVINQILNACGSKSTIIERSMIFKLLSALNPNVSDQLFEHISTVLTRELAENSNTDKTGILADITKLVINCMYERSKCGLKLSQPTYLGLSDNNVVALPACPENISTEPYEDENVLELLRNVLNYSIDSICVLKITGVDFRSWEAFGKMRSQSLHKIDLQRITLSQAQITLLLSAPKLADVHLISVKVLAQDAKVCNSSFENANTQEINYCNIINLHISDTNLTTLKIFKITDLPNLTSLKLKSVVLTNRQMKNLLQSPKLEEFVYDGFNSKKTDIIPNIVTLLPECEHLNVLRLNNLDMPDKMCISFTVKTKNMSIFAMENINTDVVAMKTCIVSMLELQSSVKVSLKNIGLKTQDADLIHCLLNDSEKIEVESFIKKEKKINSLNRNFVETKNDARLFDCEFQILVANEVDPGQNSATCSDEFVTAKTRTEESIVQTRIHTEHNAENNRISMNFLGIYRVHMDNVIVDETSVDVNCVRILEAAFETQQCDHHVHGSVDSENENLQSLCTISSTKVRVFEGHNTCQALKRMIQKEKFKSHLLPVWLYRTCFPITRQGQGSERSLHGEDSLEKLENLQKRVALLEANQSYGSVKGTTSDTNKDSLK